MSSAPTTPGVGSPVFVVGASRSGTALLRSALNGNPLVALAGETHYFDDLRLRLSHRGAAPLEAGEQQQCEDYFLALSHRPYGHGGSPAHARMDRQALRDLAAACGGGGDGYFEAFCRLSAAGREELRHWGEKTPRHVFRLPEILTRYPEARVVAMYRDPRAVVASYRDWRNQGGFDLEADVDHAQALEVESARTRASYDPTVASLLWKATVAAGRQAQERFGKDRVRLQRYEDLVDSPRDTLEEISEWLGVPFDTGMLDVPMHNSSVAAYQQSAGVSREPVLRWRKVLSPGEVALVQWWCGSELEALGFPVDAVALGTGEKLAVAGRLPVTVVRVGWVNRHRMGRVGSYVWRRAGLLVRR